MNELRFWVIAPLVTIPIISALLVAILYTSHRNNAQAEKLYNNLMNCDSVAISLQKEIDSLDNELFILDMKKRLDDEL